MTRAEAHRRARSLLRTMARRSRFVGVALVDAPTWSVRVAEGRGYGPAAMVPPLMIMWFGEQVSDPAVVEAIVLDAQADAFHQAPIAHYDRTSA